MNGERRFKITYKGDKVDPVVVSADFLKYDSGVVLLIRESENQSRVVTAVNMESIRDVIEIQP